MLRLLSGFSIVALLVLSSPAAGSTTGHLDFDTLVQRSDRVVLGECVTVSSAWDEDGKRIFTYATYEVLDTLKGDAGGQRITVRSMGGTVGRITQWAIGAPRFVEGKRDVLFLKAIPDSTHLRVYGLGEGQLQVRQDRKGRWHARAGLATEHVEKLREKQAPNGDPPPEAPAGARGTHVTFMPLDAMKSLVRRTAREVQR